MPNTHSRPSHAPHLIPGRRAAAALALSGAAVLLAGCVTSSVADATDGAPEASARAATATHPLTIDNCGTEVEFTEAPARVVTIKSSTLELMLALGVGDRVVGTAFSDGPVPAEYAAAAEGLDVLADRIPSQEATLAVEPDLVFAGWESNLTAEGAGARDTLSRLGVASYVAPAACQGEGYRPDPLTFDDVFAGFAEAGAIFGVDDAAETLIATQRAALESITPDARGLTALWYSSGTDQPFVGAGAGAPQMIMDAAGLDNIFGDVRDSWTSVSWETVVEADPDVIVLVDATWNTAAAKISVLESNPATAALPAVKAGSYVIVDFPATEAGVRNVDAVSAVVEQLRALQ